MKNKKKIGIAALVATLSAAFICSSLTPTFAAAADTNTNSTVSIPSALNNGKEIAAVVTNKNGTNEYGIELENGKVMILYTDNTYDIVKIIECKKYNWGENLYTHSYSWYVVENIEGVHEGWFEPRTSMEISFEIPDEDEDDRYIPPYVDWNDGGYIGKDSVSRLDVMERIYEIYIDGKLVCKTNDPEVVKSYGFVGKRNEAGHYVDWVYQENTEDILVEYNEKQDKPLQELFDYFMKPNPPVYIKKGKQDICIMARTGKYQEYWQFINGVIIESGELPEETEKPVEPTEPEETEKPVEPTEPEETEKPVEPTEPEETEKPVEPTEPEETEKPVEPTEPEETEKPVEPTEPSEPPIITITTKEHDNNAKETVMLVFRLPNNSKDDTEITTPTVDIAALEAEVIEAERIAEEARTEADRLTTIANEKRAALEAARQ